MRTELYWIAGTCPGRVAIMPRPRGGDWLEDEVRGWRDAGVDVVVSLLEPQEVADLELAEEEKQARANRIDYLSLPIADRGVPGSRDAVSDLVTRLAEDVRSGKRIAIHCRQGIGRAALVAASVLIRLGIDPEPAIESVATARGRPVPETPEQRQWITEFARQPMKPVAS